MLQRMAESAAQARGGVYVLRDPATGKVMRTGRRANLAQREAQHLRDAALKNFEFETVYRTDIYAEQRGLEQILHDTHNAPFDFINAIGPRNPNLDGYLDAAKKFLARLAGG
jgi:hypothetical protein